MRAQKVNRAKPNIRRGKTKPNCDDRLAAFLREAEVTGVLRWVLRGASRALSEIECNETGLDSRRTKMLRQRRDVLTRHILSLLNELDVGTQIEVARDLIGYLSCRGSREACSRATAAGSPIEVSSTAADGMFLLLRVIVPVCRQLLEEGHNSFASEVVLHASALIEQLNKFAEYEPDLLRDIAAERTDWPILASRHFPKKPQFNALADRLGIASKAAIRPKSHQTWDPTTTLNRYLVNILTVECWGGGRPLTRQTVPYYLDRVLMPLFERVADEVGGWENYDELKAIAATAAKRGKRGVQRSEIRNRVKKALLAMAR